MALASCSLGTMRVPNRWLTWGDVQGWDNGSGHITVVRSKTDAGAPGRCGGHHTRRHAHLKPSGRRVLVAGERCLGCRNPRSPGG